jgi:hypothetical protein
MKTTAMRRLCSRTTLILWDEQLQLYVKVSVIHPRDDRGQSLLEFEHAPRD